MTPVLIIGGGIGGMTLAAALHRLGIEAHLYERAPEIQEVGAGIALWPNALFSMEQIGAAESITRSCRMHTRSEIRSWRGPVLSAVDFATAWPDVGAVGFHIVHRARLLAALQARVPPAWISTGHRCVRITQDAASVQAHFDNGLTATGALLVGADGIRSVVREHAVGKDPLRYSGETCFRGIARLRIPAQDALREVQGPAHRFGVAPIDEDTVYWFATYTAPASTVVPQAQRRELLLRRFQGWPLCSAALIEATPEEQILQNDLSDRVPVSSWSRGRVTLLGDAAHPALPNLGQGANMAIDDAIVLARALHEVPDPGLAFSRYEVARRARTRMIVKRSWLFGVLARWHTPLAVAAREALLKLIPQAITHAEMRRLAIERVAPLPAA